MKNLPRFLFIWDKIDSLKTISLSRKKVIWLSITSVILFAVLLFFSINFLTEAIYQTKLAQVKRNNQRFLRTIFDLKKRMELMESEITVLVEKDRALRSYMDLPEIDKDVRKLGIGGRRNNKSTELDNLLPDNSLKLSILAKDFDKLARELKLEKISYESIYDAFKYRSDQIQSTPSIRPVNSGYITDGFGYRKDPFTGRRGFHYGIDISTPTGTPVYATANGVAHSAKYALSYGKILILDHGFGYSTVYAHLSRILVRPGDVVKRGQKIAEVGCTGRSTAPHLHYEVRQFNIHKNPLDHFFAGYIR